MREKSLGTCADPGQIQRDMSSAGGCPGLQKFIFFGDFKDAELSGNPSSSCLEPEV